MMSMLAHSEGPGGLGGGGSSASPRRSMGKAGQATCWNTEILLRRIESPSDETKRQLDELQSLIADRENCFLLVKQTNTQIEKLLALRMSTSLRLSEEQKESIPTAIEQLRARVHQQMEDFKRKKQTATPAVVLGMDCFFRLYSEDKLNGRKMSWARLEELFDQLKKPAMERENSKLINRVAGLIEKLTLKDPLNGADIGFFLALAAVYRKANEGDVGIPA